jgi:NADH:ubiquinone oxidoreductase subunit 2 (subunit N)
MFLVNPQNQPSGPLLIAALLLCVCGYLLVAGVLVASGRIALTSAAFLLEGLEVMGSGIFFAVAAAALVIAVGLLRRNNWARRGAALLIAAAFVGAVPAVSSAIADFRFATLTLQGAKVIILVALWFYLQQATVRESFR